MKWLLVATCCFFLALVLTGVFAFHYRDQTQPYINDYANHASVLGFFVSVVGFILTVWAVLETLRVSNRAEKEIEIAFAKTQSATNALLDKIRGRMIEDTCEQAILFASLAQDAIRSGLWFRVVETCTYSRRLGVRLLDFSDLSESECTAIREILEELSSSIAWIERYKVAKKDAPPGMPIERRQPVDSLIDVLDKIRSRLHQRILEVSHASDRPTD